MLRHGGYGVLEAAGKDARNQARGHRNRSLEGMMDRIAVVNGVEWWIIMDNWIMEYCKILNRFLQ